MGEASKVATYMGSALAITSWSDIGVILGIIIGIAGFISNHLHNRRMERIAREQVKNRLEKE